jgi:hypothetical protein
MFGWFADILVNAMTALTVGFVAYLGWLAFKYNLKRRKEQKAREYQRRVRGTVGPVTEPN